MSEVVRNNLLGPIGVCDRGPSCPRNEGYRNFDVLVEDEKLSPPIAAISTCFLDKLPRIAREVEKMPTVPIFLVPPT